MPMDTMPEEGMLRMVLKQACPPTARMNMHPLVRVMTKRNVPKEAICLTLTTRLSYCEPTR